MTNAEYDLTVAALLGAPEDTSRRFGFRDDTVAENGFDNRVETLGISATRVQEYAAAAQALAAGFMERAGGDTSAALGCDGEVETCLPQFVEGFGRRFYRRPLRPEEREGLLEVGRAAPEAAGPMGPFTLVLEALLQSPQFLFRVSHHDQDRFSAAVDDQLEQFDYLLKRMKEVQWGATNLLENSLVLCGSGLQGRRHRNENIQVLLAGQAGGRLETGRAVNVGSEAVYSRVLVTILHLLGLGDIEYGDPRYVRDGPIDQLL